MHNSVIRDVAGSNFHSVGDGRGRRNVFVNGNKIKNCIWADIDRGIAVFARTLSGCTKQKGMNFIRENFAEK